MLSEARKRRVMVGQREWSNHRQQPRRYGRFDYQCERITSLLAVLDQCRWLCAACRAESVADADTFAVTVAESVANTDAESVRHSGEQRSAGEQWINGLCFISVQRELSGFRRD